MHAAAGAANPGSELWPAAHVVRTGNRELIDRPIRQIRSIGEYLIEHDSQ
jgi:hypothetical protein